MKKNARSCDLQSCFLCKGCLPEWIPAISSKRQNIVFKKGEQIFEEGGQATGIYFLYKGRVKVHKRWGDEKQLILHFAKEGDMIGYRGLGDDRTYPVTATALEDITVCFIDIAFFEATLQVNHQLTYSLMQFYANELLAAEQRMRNLAHMDVKGRVADTLLTLKRKFGRSESGAVDTAFSRQDMASYSGTTYETFFRVLNDMVKEHMVSLDGKAITILHEASLEQLLATR
jgi:CRP-like cAMP-binding protein